MKIRQCRERDCAKVKRFVTNILEDIFKSPARDLEDLDNIKKNFEKFWLVEKRDKILGTIGIKNEKGKARVSRMYVDKYFRGKGIGKKLIRKALEYCKYKYNEIFLSTYKQMNSIGFYEKMGFKIFKEEGNVVTMRYMCNCPTYT